MKRKRPGKNDPPRNGLVAPLQIIDCGSMSFPQGGPPPKKVIILPDGLMVYPEEVPQYAVGPWEGWVVHRGWLVDPKEVANEAA